ncbi:MAG: hypothetical protein JWN44_1165 [Myxococcales bacterium]|nr:hypothetical protein [Myxococcales bacterium]
MRLLALVVVVAGAGCAPETGLLLEVKGPDGTTSTAAGITKLDFVVAHPSWCDRWVGVEPAMHTSVDVAGRDLTKKPYLFRVNPSHTTDLGEYVYAAALAYGADGRLLGEASFDAHPLDHGNVLKRSSGIFLFNHTAQLAGGPNYVTSDGCVCTPGEPWIGTGSTTGCDSRVITSFDRLVATAGCELTPKGAPLPVPACDGQAYPGEATDRAMPCWGADAGGGCRMTARNCRDHDGVGFTEECNTGGTDALLPSVELCTRYLACEQDPCSDVAACFKSKFTQKANLRCRLPIDPTTMPGEKLKPCAGGSWKTALPASPTSGTTCIAAMPDGVELPPYTLGFVVPMQTAVQATASSCPNNFGIESIDAPYPSAVPDSRELDIVMGEHLVHVTLQVVRSCTGGASLTCSVQ